MRDYLLHVLDRYGRSAATELTSYDTEEAAIRYALGPDFPYGCELWDAYRMVGRFCGPSHGTVDAAAVKAAA